MTTTYPGSPVAPTTIQTPDDSDEPSGALFSTPLKSLQDAAQYFMGGIANLKNHGTLEKGFGAITLAASFANLSSDALVITPNVGDLIVVVGMIWDGINAGGAADHRFQLTHESASVGQTRMNFVPCELMLEAGGTDAKTVPIVGFVTASVNEATSIRLQGETVTGSGLTTLNYLLFAVALRGAY